MNKIIILVILGSGILSGQRQDVKNQDPWERGMVVNALSKNLGLSEEQAETFRIKQKEIKQKIAPLIGKIQRLSLEKKLAATEETPDREKIMRIIDEMLSIQREIQVQWLDHQLELKSILDPAQKIKFDQMLLAERSRSANFKRPNQNKDRRKHNWQY